MQGPLRRASVRPLPTTLCRGGEKLSLVRRAEQSGARSERIRRPPPVLALLDVAPESVRRIRAPDRFGSYRLFPARLFLMQANTVESDTAV